MITGVFMMVYFAYQLLYQEAAQQKSLDQAISFIEDAQAVETSAIEKQQKVKAFQAEYMTTFGTLEIPKLKKTIGIVEGSDGNALNKGVGHMQETSFPGQGEQIILSGHRDTVFRNFGKLEIGDEFIVTMPYGTFTYEIKETKIVQEDDTTIVKKMGEEVLLVSTCYPFNVIGSSPDRFIAYAYPVKN
jgi:sortase A